MAIALPLVMIAVNPLAADTSLGFIPGDSVGTIDISASGVTPFMAAGGLGWWEGETPGPLTGTPESDRIETLTFLLDLTHADLNAMADFGDVPLTGDCAEVIAEVKQLLR